MRCARVGQVDSKEAWLRQKAILVHPALEARRPHHATSQILDGGKCPQFRTSVTTVHTFFLLPFPLTMLCLQQRRTSLPCVPTRRAMHHLMPLRSEPIFYPGLPPRLPSNSLRQSSLVSCSLEQWGCWRNRTAAQDGPHQRRRPEAVLDGLVSNLTRQARHTDGAQLMRPCPCGWLLSSSGGFCPFCNPPPRSR